jgi:hypothetical protein
MQSTKFKAADKIQNKLLVSYQVTIQQQQMLLANVKKLLPNNIAKQLMYCVISDATLTLFVENSAWSSNVRFYATEILQELQRDARYQGVKKVQCRLLALNSGIQQDKRTAIIPTNETIAYIACVRQQEDILSRALANLAQTLTVKRNLKGV